MKIIDCTTYYSEDLMLDVRFNILDEYVSKFIITESRFSHSGEKKSLNFNINNFPKFKDKIEYIVIEKEPIDLIYDENLIKNSYYKRLNSLKRIEQSYEYMLFGLDGANEDDLILLSDNDEIPDLSEVLNNGINNNFILFKQLFFYYKFNLLYDQIKWFGTKGCKKKKLKNLSSLRNLKNRK